MAKLSLYEVVQSQLASTPIVDGRFVFCKDTCNLYRDVDSVRTRVGNDIEVVTELPLAPIDGKVYIIRPNEVYIYNEKWVRLNDDDYTIEATKNDENVVDVSLKHIEKTKSNITVTGIGITTVSTGVNGELLIQTPDPNNIINTITTTEIDALLMGENLPEQTEVWILGRSVLG